MKKTSIGNFSKIAFLVLSSSLFVGFYLGETISGPGSKSDFYYTWNYVLNLQENILADPEQWTVHTPLHYIILSKLNLIFDSQEFVRFIACASAILIPYLFFLNLKIKFPDIEKNILFIFSLSIYLYPSFRYSAVWANDHITALIFFLLSTLFYFKWEKIKAYYLNKDLILSTFFLALAVYTRQYYALIFIYFLFIFFEKLSFINFIKISLIIFVFSLPGFWLIFNFPSLLKTTFTSRFHNTFLVNFSILGFYLLPFFIGFLLQKKNKIFDNKRFQLCFLISIILIISLVSIGFDYLNFNKAGGGFFLKISYIFFNNPYFFFLTSWFGAFSILFLSTEDKKNALMFLLLLFGFSGFVIYQKYFEPMFIFILLLMIKSSFIYNFFNSKKNLLVYYSYVFLYFISAILNDFFKITSNIQY